LTPIYFIHFRVAQRSNVGSKAGVSFAVAKVASLLLLLLLLR
jgi:hypothetical protein